MSNYDFYENVEVRVFFPNFSYTYKGHVWAYPNGVKILGQNLSLLDKDGQAAKVHVRHYNVQYSVMLPIEMLEVD